MPGVVDVKQIPQGVAVYADEHLRGAEGPRRAEGRMGPVQGRDPLERTSSRPTIAKLLRREGPGGRPSGRCRQGLRRAGVQTLEARSSSRSSPMRRWSRSTRSSCEPRMARIDIYSGAQFPGMDQAHAPPRCSASIRPGAASTPSSPAAASAGARSSARPTCSEAADGLQGDRRQTRPVKHMWTREDDIRGGFYRPMYVHQHARRRRRGRQDRRLGPGDRRPVDHGARPSSTRPRSRAPPNLPYAIANLRVDVAQRDAAGAAAVVALGRPHPYRLRRRDLRRRAAARWAARIRSRAGWRC